MNPIELVKPDLRFKASFLEALIEYQAESRYMDLDLHVLQADFESYVSGLLAKEGLREGSRVPETVYWAIDSQGEFLGRISLRHELNVFLSKVGGHIGYDVRPSRRRQGHASEMLRLCLESPRARQISKLLLTCDEDNLASKSVIEKNGGVLRGRYQGEPIEGMDAEQAEVASRTKLQFWIEI